MKEQVRRLQKDGEVKVETLEEALMLTSAAHAEDIRWGIKAYEYKIARSFKGYKVVQLGGETKWN